MRSKDAPRRKYAAAALMAAGGPPAMREQSAGAAQRRCPLYAPAREPTRHHAACVILTVVLTDYPGKTCSIRRRRRIPTVAVPCPSDNIERRQPIRSTYPTTAPYAAKRHVESSALAIAER